MKIYYNIFLLLVFFSNADKAAMLHLPQSHFNVGFQRFYVFDSSRKYPLLFEPKFKDSTLYFRPMVVQVWYPTLERNTAIFPYAHYIDFKTEDKSLAVFLQQLKQYNFNSIKENSFRGSAFKGDTTLGNALFDSLMKLDCGIQENAKLIGKKLPLIVYQQSLGGTIEENALLCQKLAAKGFVVINCAYQSEMGGKMYADWNLERAEKDVSFLIQFSAKNFPIDTGNIHLLGFSFGAQSNFNLLAKSLSIRSVVSLDSRLEYYFTINPRGYKNLPQTLLANKEKINIPILFFTNPSAAYCIFDSLLYADRYYATAKGMEHYDFCSQKQMSYAYLNNLHTDEQLRLKNEIYTKICQKTISFFKFYSQNANASKRIEHNGSRNLSIEKMPKGQSRPMLAKGKPKNARQVILSIPHLGIAYVSKHYPNTSLSIDEELLNNYAYFLMKENNNQLAIDVLKWALTQYPKSANLHDSIAEAYALNNDTSNALLHYQQSIKLNPENKNAHQKIEQLKKQNK